MIFLKKFIAVRLKYNTILKGLFILCTALVFSVLAHTFLKSINGTDKSEWFGDDFSTELFDPSVQNRNLKFLPVKEFKLKGKTKFANEDARPVGFTPKNISINKNSGTKKIIYLATKFFNQWNLKHYYFLQLGQASFIRYPCPINNCFVTNNPSDIQKSHAVLFHVRDLEVDSIPTYRAPEQIYILYSMEPSWLENRDMRRYNGVFNWTMSYRRTSDVHVTYGFIGKKKQTLSNNSNKLNLDNMYEKKSNKAVWYVSNCQTDSNREGYIKRLRKIYPVDVIGGCGTEGCRPAETKKCYNKIETEYMFYMAFENAICQDYVTEKLFNPLEYYIIPVTFGGANYSNIMPSNSIINAMDFSSPEELGHYLWTVSQNKTLYLSYFAWKGTYRSYLQPWMCDLCQKLHDPISYQTRYDLESWWDEEKSCLTWSEDFRPLLNHTFPKYHTSIFK